jgi:lysophospholipase L1-like esterase
MKTTQKPTLKYLALGDSISIDRYTNVEGGGAAAQLYARLRREDPAWELDDQTFDGCTIRQVPVNGDNDADIATLTIGGNDLLQAQYRDPNEFGPKFMDAYRDLCRRIRSQYPRATVTVGNIYNPQGVLPDQLRQGLELVNQFIAAVLPDYGFILADINAAFRGHEEEYLTLQIEPSLAGATCIAKLFYDAAFPA